MRILNIDELTEEQLSYFAGFFEADGSSTIGIGKVGQAGGYIQVAQQDPTVLYIFQEWFGGRIYDFRPRPNVWYWNLGARASAEVLKRTLPYMRVPFKIEKTRRYIEFMEAPTKLEKALLVIKDRERSAEYKRWRYEH